MSHLPPINAKKLEKILKKLGFRFIRQKGSHAFYEHPDGRTTIIPVHFREEIGRGLLHKIIMEDIGISIEDFNRLR